jgi:2-phospho-L-lactate guanylyltransferase
VPVDAPAGTGDWVVALPLKGLSRAKSRLQVPPRVRASLARAMALDTAASALACPVVREVWVVCDDDASAAFAELGCRVLPDPGSGGLNGALAAAHDRARAVVPAAGFASLVADLPAMGAEDLTDALLRAGRYERSFVPDAQGTGTTLLAARPGAGYAPRYGSASAERHRRAGAVPLPLSPDSPLRRDVDTLADLDRAASDGLGWRTARLLSTIRCGRPGAAAVHSGVPLPAT